MMQLLKGSLLGQGQAFCQGEGILISQTGNGHLIVSTGQSGLHLPLRTPASNQPVSSRAAETPLSSRSRAAETPLPSTRTATPVQTLTTASRLTPVGLTSSGTQPVSITRPKKKACQMTTSPEFQTLKVFFLNNYNYRCHKMSLS